MFCFPCNLLPFVCPHLPFALILQICHPTYFVSCSFCENGELHCSRDCGNFNLFLHKWLLCQTVYHIIKEMHCVFSWSPVSACKNGKVCIHCAEYPVNTARKTCDSLSKPTVGQQMTYQHEGKRTDVLPLIGPSSASELKDFWCDFQGTDMACDSGCYCPHDQYEDHFGNCVPLENCTCVYSGKVFHTGQHVRTNCKTWYLHYSCFPASWYEKPMRPWCINDVYCIL